MIRINTNDFDDKAIKEIYKSTGDLVAYLEKKINKEYKHVNSLTKGLLKDWFFEEDAVSKEKVSNYLLDRNTRKRIIDFAKRVCAIEWGNEELGEAFIRYHAVAKKPEDDTKTIPPSALLEGLANYIQEPHISLKMFELFSKETLSYQPLEMSDVQTANNSEKLITLNHEKTNDEIEGVFSACKKIFNYRYFAERYRHKVLNAIGVSVCPYCNRQYITAYETNKGKRNTGDIEHFYDKSTYPFLALSLYNFVPSCQICNSRFKGTKDFFINPHVNPYEKDFDNTVRFQIENIDAFIDAGVKPTVRLAYIGTDQEVINSVETFHLDQLYENHQDYAKEIIYKARIFNESKIKEYLEQYNGLFTTKSELYQTLYGNYLKKEHQGKRPLAKLTQDLLIELHVMPE